MSQNMDKLKERFNKLKDLKKGGGGGAGYLDLKPGVNVIRIIPPKAPREDFWVEKKVRFGVGPNKKMIVSPSQEGKPDPAQDEYNRLMAMDDEASKKRATGMREKTRVFMFVVERDNPEKTGQAQCFSTNLFVLRDILAIMADSEFGDITDPEKGVDITINYTPGERGSFPEWVVTPRRHSSPLGHPELLETDLFEANHIGEVSDHDYILACIEGTEKAWLEARKQERQAQGGGSSTKTHSEMNEDSAPAPQGNENSAVQQELDKIRQQKASAPPPPTPQAPPAPPTPGTPAALLQATGYQAVIDGAGKPVEAGQIQQLVDAGQGAVLIWHPQHAPQWTAAEAVGFVKASAAPPPPPGKSQVGADLAAALK